MTASTDPSCRHVLPPGSPYLKNMPALWALDPELAAAIESIDPDPAYEIETARSGDPTLRAPTEDDRRIYLHSRYQPADEAAKSLLAIDLSAAFFNIHGLGLGYQLQLLFDQAGTESIFCLFEPDLQVLHAAFSQLDLSRVIASRRLMIFTRLDKGLLFNRLNAHTPMFTLGVAAVEHLPSVARQPGFHQQARAMLAEFSAFARTNMNTLVINSKKTIQNIIANLPRYAAAPDIGARKDLYKGQLAVVVAAGPSLRKNKHRLKELAGKAVIIAVQTTLQPLLEMGIVPDFVTALDYHEICSRFFEKLPPSLSTELVAEPKATHAIFKLHTGPTTIIGNDMAESLLREIDLGKTKLRAGSTVAHLAFYLAEHLGCDPIAFVGQDLGFSDGLYYSPGTSYDDVWRPECGRFCTPEMKQWEQIVRERPILRKIPDQSGNPMYTEERLFTYLQQFERDFSLTQTTIIDATEGGAAKRGTITMPLAEVIAKHAVHSLHRQDSPAVRKPPADWSDCKLSLQKRQEEAKQIELISRQTLPLLEQIRDQIADQPAVTRLIARIDALRSQMNELGQTYDLVIQLTQSSELERFQADRKIAAARLSGIDRQKNQITRDIANVRAVMHAAAEFQQWMEEAAAD